MKSPYPFLLRGGIPQTQGILSGKEPDEIVFKENGLLDILHNLNSLPLPLPLPLPEKVLARNSIRARARAGARARNCEVMQDVYCLPFLYRSLKRQDSF